MTEWQFSSPSPSPHSPNSPQRNNKVCPPWVGLTDIKITLPNAHSLTLTILTCMSVMFLLLPESSDLPLCSVVSTYPIYFHKNFLCVCVISRQSEKPRIRQKNVRKYLLGGDFCYATIFNREGTIRAKFVTVSWELSTLSLGQPGDLSFVDSQWWRRSDIHDKTAVDWLFMEDKLTSPLSVYIHFAIHSQVYQLLLKNLGAPLLCVIR